MNAKKQTLLWAISGAELPGTSYVFGTMHVRDRRVFQNLDTVYQKIEACEAFATEFHLEDGAAQMQPQDLLLPDQQSLRDLLPEKKYRKLRRILLKSVELDLDQFQRYKPIILLNFVTEKMLRSEAPHALDEHLWHYAKNLDKELLGIETYQEQLQALAKLSITEQIQALLRSGRHISRFRKQLSQLTAVYTSGDIQRIFQQSKRQAGVWRKPLLYQRNAIMADRIGQLVKHQTLFAAIGAGHLGGGKGVLRVLKHRQLNVKAVPNIAISLP